MGAEGGIYESVWEEKGEGSNVVIIISRGTKIENRFGASGFKHGPQD